MFYDFIIRSPENKHQQEVNQLIVDHQFSKYVYTEKCAVNKTGVCSNSSKGLHR